VETIWRPSSLSDLSALTICQQWMHSTVHLLSQLCTAHHAVQVMSITCSDLQHFAASCRNSHVSSGAVTFVHLQSTASTCFPSFSLVSSQLHFSSLYCVCDHICAVMFVNSKLFPRHLLTYHKAEQARSVPKMPGMMEFLVAATCLPRITALSRPAP
jgi:hypothetical protein